MDKKTNEKKYRSGHTTLHLSGSGRRKGIKVWQESNEQRAIESFNGSLRHT